MKPNSLGRLVYKRASALQTLERALEKIKEEAKVLTESLLLRTDAPVREYLEKHPEIIERVLSCGYCNCSLRHREIILDGLMLETYSEVSAVIRKWNVSWDGQAHIELTRNQSYSSYLRIATTRPIKTISD